MIYVDYKIPSMIHFRLDKFLRELKLLESGCEKEIPPYLTLLIFRDVSSIFTDLTAALSRARTSHSNFSVKLSKSKSTIIIHRTMIMFTDHYNSIAH